MTQSNTTAAVDYATPVRPLVGAACHAVWAGETPAEQIRAASYAWWRQAGQPACKALALVRADVASGKLRFPDHYPDANKTHAAHGESRMRFIENPSALGLRLVGLAHVVAAANVAYLRPVVDHTGWYLDPHGHEHVCGVVYRMSGKGGRGRYLVGYADPWNCDKDGCGPALLSLDPMIGDPVHSDLEYDPVLRDAARRADEIAGRMAEEERDYQTALEAGRDARQAGRTMRETGACYVRALRACRMMFRSRHRIGLQDARVIMTAQVGQARELCARLMDERAVFRAALETRAEWVCAGGNGWLEGYDEG